MTNIEPLVYGCSFGAYASVAVIFVVVFRKIKPDSHWLACAVVGAAWPLTPLIVIGGLLPELVYRAVNGRWPDREDA